MDEIIEVLLEFVAEVYLDLAENLLPDKDLSKGKRFFLKLICAIVSVCTLGCIIVGIVLLVQERTSKSTITGIILLAVGAVILVAHIIIALCNHKKKSKLQ